MFERVSDDERAGMEVLASRVRNELAAAGLPVLAGLNPVLAGGAEVIIDDGADAECGVYAGWSASPRLRACAQRAFGLRQLDNPLLRHSRQVAEAMVQAMASILTSAGFTVEHSTDDYRTTNPLRVADGPVPRAKPMWSLRDEELAMPGWKTDNPDEDTT
jgi:hypothetical protein